MFEVRVNWFCGWRSAALLLCCYKRPVNSDQSSLHGTMPSDDTGTDDEGGYYCSFSTKIISIFSQSSSSSQTCQPLLAAPRTIQHTERLFLFLETHTATTTWVVLYRYSYVFCTVVYPLTHTYVYRPTPLSHNPEERQNKQGRLACKLHHAVL